MHFKYKYDELFNPVLQSLHNLGGSGSIEEIEKAVSDILKLTDEEMSIIHKGSLTKFSYRLAWARTYLKNYGLIGNSTRGVWSLTPEGLKVKSVDKAQVVKKVREQFVKDKKHAKKDAELDEEAVELEWQEELLETLRAIPPDKFERLSQRLLRELGFINVEVTGKTGDGGIDGKGVIKLGGVLSFHVVFQSKRYKGSVAPSLIRDFRGAMIGRADKGLFITTGTFTSEAKKEAQRDGAPPLDLMDGYQLAEKLKELGLGIETYTVEKVNINKSWFDGI